MARSSLDSRHMSMTFDVIEMEYQIPRANVACYMMKMSVPPLFGGIMALGTGH